MRATSNRPTQSAASRQCPKCGRKSATSIVVNPGTVSRICRWCDYESTTVLADLPEPTRRTGVIPPEVTG